MVYAMGEDKTGKLWISLENAICSYTRKTQQIETFDGLTFHLPLTLSEAPFIITPGDEAYFPTLNGTLHVDLNNLHKSPFKPNIVFDHAIISSDNDSAKLIKINDVNTNIRVIKCCYNNDFVSLGIESYCYVAEDFKYVFYTYLGILELADIAVKEAYSQYDTSNKSTFKNWRSD